MGELHLDLFWQPYLVGLLMALILPLLGVYLRLREEWLAALAYGQVGAAGALIALALGWPTALGGLGASLSSALFKWRMVPRWLDRGTVFVLLLLLGWGGSMLLTSNLPMAERLGHALFEGQLYFVDDLQLYLAAGVCAVVLLCLIPLGRILLLAHLYPGYFETRRQSIRSTSLWFDLVVAASLAMAVMTLGVMAAFAMVFVPPWVAFMRGRGWRQAHVLAVALNLIAYTLAFFMALYLDQAFGPVLVMTLVITGLAGINFFVEDTRL